MSELHETAVAALSASPSSIPDPGVAGLVEAAKAFADRLDLIHEDTRFKSVWIIAQLHSQPYSGPTYTDEFAALKAALASFTGGQ